MKSLLFIVNMYRNHCCQVLLTHAIYYKPYAMEFISAVQKVLDVWNTKEMTMITRHYYHLVWNNTERQNGYSFEHCLSHTRSIWGRFDHT